MTTDRAKIAEAIASAALCGVTVEVTPATDKDGLCCATASASNVVGTKSTCLNANELVAVTGAIDNCYKKAFGGTVN